MSTRLRWRSPRSTSHLTTGSGSGAASDEALDPSPKVSSRPAPSKSDAVDKRPPLALLSKRSVTLFPLRLRTNYGPVPNHRTTGQDPPAESRTAT
jgi:hypothetical protein